VVLFESDKVYQSRSLVDASGSMQLAVNCVCACAVVEAGVSKVGVQLVNMEMETSGLASSPGRLGCL
jgi:hypothetical protein